MLLLQQFLPTRRTSVSSEFFIFQQDSATAHMALDANNFPHNFSKMLSDFKNSSKTDSTVNL